MRSWNYSGYKEYYNAQIERWRSKSTTKRGSSMYERHIEWFVKNIGIESIKSVICQGVRNSNEVLIFRRLIPEATIIGTDIACENSDIVRCDFANLPLEWENKFDFLYSNSIDHSFNVDKTLSEWFRVTKDYAVIAFSKHNPSVSDPFSFDEFDVRTLCEKHGFTVLHIDNSDKDNVIATLQIKR